MYSDALPQKADLDNLYDYAFNLHKKKDLDKAIESYKTVLKYNDTNPEVYVNLALAYNQNKDYENASNTIKLAKTKFPTNKQVLDVANTIVLESNNRVLTQAANLFGENKFQEALNVYLSVKVRGNEGIANQHEGVSGVM